MIALTFIRQGEGERAIGFYAQYGLTHNMVYTH
ncbi:hypothetical protein YPC_2900 [Yersinia pestis biovar Medievalis str. Harbin 35]|nr:hypothetical protein YPC_2900 [Yersinia pestis biovar Medievalis str. Harbin 35]EEO75143.1 hypothetical protein YP516_3030 [Yersinia pestis Nepal516]EEO81760.1 hypothetical protein YPF_1734 [Yersinia pestis biovar Orientalis str. India 195]EEO87662.1 hypothetical protein YPH_3629 [Yersinia pestis biovar Orientalis str. PEXU2]EEO90829.1 hypothetical protein YPS_2190 [Yersinia pestis Pestoides A]